MNASLDLQLDRVEKLIMKSSENENALKKIDEYSQKLVSLGMTHNMHTTLTYEGNIASLHNLWCRFRRLRYAMGAISGFLGAEEEFNWGANFCYKVSFGDNGCLYPMIIVDTAALHLSKFKRSKRAFRHTTQIKMDVSKYSFSNRLYRFDSFSYW